MILQCMCMHAIYSSSIELAMDIRKYLVPDLPSEKGPLSQSLSPTRECARFARSIILFSLESTFGEGISHLYIWIAIVGKELDCSQEEHDAHDPFAVFTALS